MKTDLEYIKCKLDQLATELIVIKNSLKSLNTLFPLFSFSEAAEYMRLTRSGAYHLINSGQLKRLQHHKSGRLLFSKNHLINIYMKTTNWYERKARRKALLKSLAEADKVEKGKELLFNLLAVALITIIKNWDTVPTVNHDKN